MTELAMAPLSIYVALPLAMTTFFLIIGLHIGISGQQKDWNAHILFLLLGILLGIVGTLTLCSLYLTTCSETTLADHITNLLNYRQTIYQNLLAAVQNGTMELA